MPTDPKTRQIEFHYYLRCSGDEPKDITFRVIIDPDTLEHVATPKANPPDWTLADRDRCGGCELDFDKHKHCPAALSLVDLVENFNELLSYEEVEVTVITPHRTIIGMTTVQRALSSLIGLHMATSGCPTLAKLKPMARFHLPFASRDETMFRAAGTYLLGQYFLAKQGQAADFDLHGLRDLYERIHDINVSLTARLRDVAEGDASVNAIVLLDLFAQELPMSIEENLADLESLFSSYFEE